VRWHDLKKQFDFIFIGLHGGAGENGSVQGMLEMLDLPYNGSSVFTSALCMDKHKTAQFLKASGFEVPEQIVVTKDAWKKNKKAIHTLLKTISAPYIIKPSDDGCSMFVRKAKNEKELDEAIAQLFKHGKERVLVEEFITGMELTVGVLGNQNNVNVLPPSHAITHHEVLSIEEKFLPGAGENQTPAPLSKDAIALIQQTIGHAFQAVGCQGYARIDCFYQTALESPTGKERLIILEINTLPGLTPATCIFHQAAEIDLKPMEFIDTIVQLGMEVHSSVSDDLLQKTVPIPKNINNNRSP
jgi:UDP-N-acetylmuramate--alanine ligase